jgi:hypothetical protein
MEGSEGEGNLVLKYHLSQAEGTRQAEVSG